MSVPIGQAATMACLLEASAPKVGNVHRGADFEDLTFYDFCLAAAAISPAMEQAPRSGVGAAVLAAIEATQRVVRGNVNLGIALLLGPLAAAGQRLGDRRQAAAAVADVLRSLTAEDARSVYRAIQLAAPGGMGEVDEMDVAGPPPDDLLAAMSAACDRDFVARQYAGGFQWVLGPLADQLETCCRQHGVPEGIVRAQLWWLAAHPDTLIARKCGPQVAEETRCRAAAALKHQQDAEAFHDALADLDFWMRSDGHRRNPGATADLIAASLFVLIRQDRLPLPTREE